EEAFEEWLRLERESWERRHLGLLARLVEGLEREGAWSRAIACAEQALGLDPLQERFHRALMSLHARAGDRAAALRQYRLCRQVVRDEVGAEPDAETTALAEAIGAGRVGRSAPAAPPRIELQVRRPSSPIIGRPYEQNALRLHLADALAGQRRLVVLEGEAGIGKSRLLEELLWRAQDGEWSAERWSALLGHSYEAEQGLPYRPFVEALGRALPRLDPRQLGVPDVWLAEVNRLLPALSERCPGLPAPPRLDPRQEQRRLFEGVSRLVSVLPGPLLLALEDLHWADEGSLALLGYLLRYDSAQRLLIVASVRTEDREEPLDRLLRSLEREGRLAWLRLGRLSAESTAQLIRMMLSEDAELLAQRVYRETEGNPLFALETVRSLLEGGVVQPASIAEAERLVIPETIQGAIAARVARLEPAARDVLNAVAVFRRAVEFDLAREVSGRSEDEALDAIEALLRTHLLREGRDGVVSARSGPSAGYGFSHGMIQQVVYEGLSAARRAVLHRRALQALEQAADGAPAEHLAYHAMRAQLWEKALHWSACAAEEATRVSAYAAAALLYRQALEALAHLSQDDDLKRRGIDLRLRLAEVAFYVQPGRLTEWLADAEREAAALGDRT